MFGALAFAIVWVAPPVLVGHDAALRWIRADGAATCIADRTLAAALNARLGGPADHGRTRIVIDGDIAPGEAGWTAVIRTTDDHGVVLGRRELREQGGDCHAIDDKLVLVIAMIIDPDLLEAAPPRPALAPREPWRFGAGAAVLAARGLLPGFGFGTAVVALIEPPQAWPIEVGATLWPRDRADAGPGGARLLQLTGGVAVCPRLGASRIGAISACAGVQAGELRARGFGYTRNELQHEWVADGTLELRLDWRLGRAAGARLGVGAWLPVSRPRFVFHDAGTDVMVYQPAIVAAVSQIAVWTRF
ncbi:MAG: hypothetical protein ABI467_30225 [Kofleriaceae bacterium]